MEYPRGIKTSNCKHISYGNRGMGLEEDLNITNEQYRLNNKAVVYKKPTPITICKVNYDKLTPIIIEAKFKTPSTTDYNGVYKGIYLDFEAKETKLNKFPLKNIHKHQLKHLNDVTNNGGFAFIIVKFATYNKVFLLKEENLNDFIQNENKSAIPIEYFIEKGYLIKTSFNPRLDYLEIIDIWIKEKKNEKIIK